MYTKNTKIVCTLGPSSNSITEITNLVQAGMNVARLNFSHGDYKTHQELINNIREVEKLTGKRIGILQDLQGPKIRLGMLPQEGIELKKNDTFILTSKKITGKNITRLGRVIPIQFKNFTKGLKKNDTIFFNDGLVEIKVLSIINKEQVRCSVKCSGMIKSRAGVHLPSATKNIQTITEKDKKDLAFGLKNNVDYVALSFVKSAKDIEDLRKLIGSENPKIIAKIELKSAVDNLESIIEAADGAMVARGDLGIDVPAEQVPLIQKRIIALSNQYAKPVITATEVLLSMVVSPRATRAEISDAANAVLDHTDAIMLSNESAIGKYPAKAAATLSKVSSAVEKEIQKYPKLFKNILVRHHDEVTCNPHCHNACELSVSTNADHLVVYTSTGYSAREVAKHRIYTPIITITESEKIARQLTLVWGLNEIFTFKVQANDRDKIGTIVQFLKKQRAVKKGDKIVIICNAGSKEKLISNIKI